MRFFIFILISAFIVSCKNDGSLGNNIDIDEIAGGLVDPATLKLPKACSMISPEKVQEILNTPSSVTTKESVDPSESNTQQACFFRWEDPNTSNAAILIQIMTNQVYEEYPTYIAGYVENKLKEGESMMGQDDLIEYKPFKVGNKTGAYSFQQGRFYWSGGGNYLFMLAFNVSTLSEAKMVSTAQKIIGEIHKNFAAQM